MAHGTRCWKGLRQDVAQEAKYFILRKSKTFTSCSFCLFVCFSNCLSRGFFLSVPLFQSGNNHCCVCKLKVMTARMFPQHFMSCCARVLLWPAFSSTEASLSRAPRGTSLSSGHLPPCTVLAGMVRARRHPLPLQAMNISRDNFICNLQAALARMGYSSS